MCNTQYEVCNRGVVMLLIGICIYSSHQQNGMASLIHLLTLMCNISVFGVSWEHRCFIGDRYCRNAARWLKIVNSHSFTVPTHSFLIQRVNVGNNDWAHLGDKKAYFTYAKTYFFSDVCYPRHCARFFCIMPVGGLGSGARSCRHWWSMI